MGVVDGGEAPADGRGRAAARGLTGEKHRNQARVSGQRGGTALAALGQEAASVRGVGAAGAGHARRGGVGLGGLDLG